MRQQDSNIKIEATGSTLNVEVSGPDSTPAVLLWNGAGCTLHMWDVVVSKLADRFRLVRFDVRGTGESTPAEDPESQYTFEQYATDANLILDTLKVSKCHVWSMAWGSRAALAYCSLNPARVISAALFDASIGAADPEAQKSGAKQAVALQIESGVSRFQRPEGWNVHQVPDAVPAALAAAAKFDLREAVARLTMPVLVATGDHDPNLASSRELEELATDARLKIFKNVGHGSVLQRPDLAADAFVEFQASI
ncbi:MAG: alpha/beta hydrolase [bacterium]|nr:alpha/beta fold hydrolase [Gammaproteobacteria bacterium]HIL97266.1 alpha/beta fold hydrolase [Pseudomonadales bacterium]